MIEEGPANFDNERWRIDSVDDLIDDIFAEEAAIQETERFLQKKVRQTELHILNKLAEEGCNTAHLSFRLHMGDETTTLENVAHTLSDEMLQGEEVVDARTFDLEAQEAYARSINYIAEYITMALFDERSPVVKAEVQFMILADTKLPHVWKEKLVAVTDDMLLGKPLYDVVQEPEIEFEEDADSNELRLIRFTRRLAQQTEDTLKQLTQGDDASMRHLALMIAVNVVTLQKDKDFELHLVQLLEYVKAGGVLIDDDVLQYVLQRTVSTVEDWKGED